MGARWSRMSWNDRNELWARRRRGESVKQIAHGLRRSSSVIHTAVAAEGGITPRPGRRSRFALTAAEREDISRHRAVWPIATGNQSAARPRAVPTEPRSGA